MTGREPRMTSGRGGFMSYLKGTASSSSMWKKCVFSLPSQMPWKVFDWRMAPFAKSGTWGAQRHYEGCIPFDFAPSKRKISCLQQYTRAHTSAQSCHIRFSWNGRWRTFHRTARRSTCTYISLSRLFPANASCVMTFRPLRRITLKKVTFTRLSDKAGAAFSWLLTHANIGRSALPWKRALKAILLCKITLFISIACGILFDKWSRDELLRYHVLQVIMQHCGRLSPTGVWRVMVFSSSSSHQSSRRGTPCHRPEVLYSRFCLITSTSVLQYFKSTVVPIHVVYVVISPTLVCFPYWPQDYNKQQTMGVVSSFSSRKYLTSHPKILHVESLSLFD